MLENDETQLMKQSLDRAIEIAGNQTELAKMCNKKQGHISSWVRIQKKVPSNLTLLIEEKTGIPRHQLRPDIYPPEEYEYVLEAKKRAV